MDGNLFSVLFVAAYAVIGIWIYRKIRNRPADEDDEPDFEFLSVREQLRAASETSEGIDDMETLQNDLAACSVDDQTVVHIEWVGHDDGLHAYDLVCDGTNTASECLAEIARREVHDLRRTLAHQCSVLSRRGRSGTNSGQNGKKGEGKHDKDLRAMRESHSDG